MTPEFQVIWTATINGHHGVDCIQDLNTPHQPTWEEAAAARLLETADQLDGKEGP